MRHLRGRTFGDLPVGATFWFTVRTRTTRGARFRQDPDRAYVKVSERQYRDVDDPEGRFTYTQDRRDAGVSTSPPGGNRAGGRRGRATVEDVEILVMDDPSPDASYLDQDDEGWAERRDAYQRGDFSFVGVRAVARIVIPTGAGGGISQTIASPGLWGIESDSDRSYFREVAKEETDQLKDMLQAMGTSTRGFASMARDAVASVDVGRR